MGCPTHAGRVSRRGVNTSMMKYGILDGADMMTESAIRASSALISADCGAAAGLGAGTFGCAGLVADVTKEVLVSPQNGQ